MSRVMVLIGRRASPEGGREGPPALRTCVCMCVSLCVGVCVCVCLYKCTCVRVSEQMCLCGPLKCPRPLC